MNQNAIIGILAAILVIGGGFWLFQSGAFGPSTTATSTPTTGTNTGTNNPPVTNNASSPNVTTGTLVVASNSTAVITGKVVSNGAQTSYWYEYGTSANLGAKTSSQNIGSGYASISAPAYISGLAANTSYSYRLVAENGFGQTRGTILSFMTNSNPAPIGSAPTTQSDTATAVTRTSANLNGRVTPNHADTSYWFEYGTTNNLGNTTGFQSAGAGTSVVTASVAISGLAPATKYYFRMNAQNEFGTINGTVLVFTTGGPANGNAPSADTTNANSVNRTTATLNGTVNPNGDSTSYWFEYSTDTALGSILGTTTHKVVAGSGTNSVPVSAPITGLAPNTNYSYRLVTMNTFGTTQGDIVHFKTNR